MSLSMALVGLAVLAFVVSVTSGGKRHGIGALILIAICIGVALLFFTYTSRTRHHAGQIEAMQQDIARQIANMNIHQLMDKADAPRIQLAPTEPESPPAPEEPQPSEPAPAVETSDPKDEAASSDGAVDPEADKAESTSDGEATGAEEADSDSDKVDGEESRDEKTSSDAASARVASDAESTADPVAATGSAPPTTTTTAKPSEPAAPLPAWIDDPPKRIGQVWREVIETDQYATVDECYRAADILMRLATYDHLARLVGMENHAEGVLVSQSLFDGRLEALDRFGIGIDYIRREIAKDEHVEKTERSFGEMKKLHTLIEFSPAVDRELRARWDAFQRQERFAVVGVGAGSILGLLCLVWGLLKIDTATKGYYTKRLFLGVPAAIIGGFLLLSILV